MTKEIVLLQTLVVPGPHPGTIQTLQEGLVITRPASMADIMIAQGIAKEYIPKAKNKKIDPVEGPFVAETTEKITPPGDDKKGWRKK